MGISHSNVMVLPKLGGDGLKKLRFLSLFSWSLFHSSLPLLLTGKTDVKIFNWLQTSSLPQRSSRVSLHLPKITRSKFLIPRKSPFQASNSLLAAHGVDVIG